MIRFLLSCILCFSLQVRALADPLTLVCDIWPPYQIQENSHVSGFRTELVKNIFEMAEIPITVIHAYPWKRALLMLEKGEVDGLFSANHTPERESYAMYPELPLTESPWVLWTREDSGISYTSFADLRGKRVGVVRGYSYTPEFWEILTQYGRPEEASSDELNFRKLAAGRLDMIVAELNNGYFIMQKERIQGIRPFAESPVKTDGLYLIFNRKRVDEKTAEKFSNALREYRNSEAYKQLHNRYFKAETESFIPEPSLSSGSTDGL
ncbi:polar amino acid transport system substrate-binding protein [Desulfobotulus alkaliphilus]|uniref:Polar amino acid transport system substrate-binding protein n=1 Tax=Desulfobotulus alkaliphilus TaxID=622671 RepID=A0A562RGD4_9BACT|nr:transporter substrate-binding domain-containing protein [Desulfobotulus alkaliphilus]TWI68105.1 polar amino acid transport system substrate-binding protein [Desulfobotulus alkaliphilus]